MKRYAIVRVDMIERKDGNTFVCPEHFEGINGKWLCANYHKGKFVASAQCKDCRYGDTKEQLVRKVKQALIRARIEEDENSKSLSWEQIAERIVEFLGVE